MTSSACHGSRMGHHLLYKAAKLRKKSCFFHLSHRVHVVLACHNTSMIRPSLLPTRDIIPVCFCHFSDFTTFGFSLWPETAPRVVCGQNETDIVVPCEYCTITSWAPYHGLMHGGSHSDTLVCATVDLGVKVRALVKVFEATSNYTYG